MTPDPLSPVTDSVPPALVLSTKVRKPEPLPKAPAGRVSWPLLAAALKLAGRVKTGSALTVAAPCTAAGELTVRVERLTAAPSAPDTVAVNV